MSIVSSRPDTKANTTITGVVFGAMWWIDLAVRFWL